MLIGNTISPVKPFSVPGGGGGGGDAWPYGTDEQWDDVKLMIHWDQLYAEGVRAGDTGVVSHDGNHVFDIPSVGVDLTEEGLVITTGKVEIPDSPLFVATNPTAYEVLMKTDQGNPNEDPDFVLGQAGSTRMTFVGSALSLRAEITMNYDATNGAGNLSVGASSDIRHFFAYFSDKVRLYRTGGSYTPGATISWGTGKDVATPMIIGAPGTYKAHRITNAGRPNPGTDGANAVPDGFGKGE